MDTVEIRQYLADQDRIIADVLGLYVENHGCPCDWPQFEYWSGKPQGPGWQDNIQNELIKAALKLDCFRRRKPETPRYGLEALVTCSACGRQWQYFSEEWRMLAFHDRLIPVHPSAASERDDALVDEKFFATVGREPNATYTLSLMEWSNFMRGLPVGESRHTSSFIRGVFAWFKRRT